MTTFTASIKRLTKIGRAASGVMEGATDLDIAYVNYGGQAETNNDGTDVAFINAPANECQVPQDINGNRLDTETPLGTTTYTSGVAKTKGFGRLVGTIASNAAGTLSVYWSNDGQNFDYIDTLAVTGSTASPLIGQKFSFEVVALYFKISFAPSALSTALRLYPLLRRLGSA